jgi:hypothetical protein
MLNARYRPVAAMSSGGQGTVYRAFDELTGSEVALKRAVRAIGGRQFEAEARLLSSLSHPRVVRILDHFSDDTGYYLAMELVAGIELGELLEQRGDPGLPVEEAIAYAVGACAGLQYVHERQIVHLDVKPQNLILARHGIVLVDFGIARPVADGEATIGMGTPRFTAPEALASGHVSPRTDVYGVAATLWMLLTGEPPGYGESAGLGDSVPGVSRELERAIRAGLELSPERRTSSAAAFARSLGATGPLEAGESTALSNAADATREPIEAVLQTAAGIFNAAAASICVADPLTGELVYECAWGAGAREIIGVRLPPGYGITGRVVISGLAEAIADCRADPRFASGIAAGTGYVPLTMMVVPLRDGVRTIGALAVLDRRDGRPYTELDIEPAGLFADLAVKVLRATGPWP